MFSVNAKVSMNILLLISVLLSFNLIITMIFLLAEILYSVCMSLGIQSYFVVVRTLYLPYAQFFIFSLAPLVIVLIILLNLTHLFAKYDTTMVSIWVSTMCFFLLGACGFILIFPLGDSVEDYITTLPVKQFFIVIASCLLLLLFLHYYYDGFFSWKHRPSALSIQICEKLLTFSLIVKKLFLIIVYIFVPLSIILYIGTTFSNLGLQNVIITYNLNDVFGALGFSLLFVFLLFVSLRYVSFVIYVSYDLLEGFRMNIIDEKQLPSRIQEWLTVNPQELRVVEPEYAISVKSAIKRISTMFGIKYLPQSQQFSTVVISPKSDYHLIKIFFTPQRIVIVGLYVISSPINKLPRKIKNITTIDLLQIFKPISGDQQNIPRVEFFDDKDLQTKNARLLKPLYKEKLNILTPFNLIDSLEEFNFFISNKYVVARSVAAKNSENIFLIHQIMKLVLKKIIPVIHIKK